MSAQLEPVSARDVHGPGPVPDLVAADLVIASSSGGGKDSQAALDEREAGEPFRRDLSMAEVIRRAGGAA